MSKLAHLILFVLLVPAVTASAQVSPAAQQLSFTSAASRVTFDVLSDTRGFHLHSYLGTLAPDLQQAFLRNLNAADGKGAAPEQVGLLVTLNSEGKLVALRLLPGTQDSPTAKEAWNAARDLKYSNLPKSLPAAGLTLRVHLFTT